MPPRDGIRPAWEVTPAFTLGKNVRVVALILRSGDSRRLVGAIVGLFFARKGLQVFDEHLQSEIKTFHLKAQRL